MFHWTVEFWNSSHPLVSVDSASPVTSVQPVAGSPVGSIAKAGSAQLTINGTEQGHAKFTNINGSSYTETLDVGSDLGSPVSSAYRSPDRFTGKIDQITIQLQ